MSPGTGCISIATMAGGGVDAERVIEYFQPGERESHIWVDIFFRNNCNEARTLLILHRGSFSARNVTKKSWLAGGDLPGRSLSWLTRRIVRLHDGSEKIEIQPHAGVKVGDREYGLWDGPEHLRTIVGDKPEADVPFTMWEIQNIPAATGCVLRLYLRMSPKTFERNVGNEGTFYAYGDAILLDKIGHEDLPCYAGADANLYKEAFDEFKRGTRIVPDLFEYLVVSPEDTALEWDAKPLSPTISPKLILDGELRRTTRWFIVDNSQRDKWSLIGLRYAGFVVKLTHGEVGATRCEKAAAG